jgi:DNA-directed RNA polymerase subunit RPC12/RpoP
MTWIDSRAIDREVAEDTDCPHCEQRCWYKADMEDDEYRAYTVCPSCGWYEEL